MLTNNMWKKNLNARLHKGCPVFANFVYHVGFVVAPALCHDTTVIATWMRNASLEKERDRVWLLGNHLSSLEERWLCS